VFRMRKVGAWLSDCDRKYFPRRRHEVQEL